MLCYNYIEAENYSGLNSDRDTEAEVEAIVRFFPEVLTRRKYDDENFQYPIQLLAFAHKEEWDPNALTQTDIDGLPLYDVEVFEFEVDDSMRSVGNRAISSSSSSSSS
ncbi:hypothetical protein FRACYDRAFT_249068 [Fragilariopsis cylindrus CCMP1102]|uniref:Uncharacterized protein n=1 Tax=Fragilariopsis cylindrus CCMP1102 TaxID=635003 RepID=A0A1E7ET55_9STRA|nr:hypothetical protein FRACYDRAFT_249068 [Fragilariopsis cylindrus CCMP1102]|eukprot:OEU09151.1 hypothetical protein FRACYDRAFT_249068 [Fragilariopsis cylindrus CCMP1102]